MTFVADQIREEISERGAIPFVRFMELALYCPLCGYYEKKRDTTGRHGDFYTSVSVGPLFGELLAFQFAEWLRELPPTDSGLKLVEAGAHDGQLAKDILMWLRLRRATLFDRVEYWIVEPSERRQTWQREVLKDYAPRVRWVTGFPALKAAPAGRTTNARPSSEDQRPVRGVIFCNELLDAMPVRRFGWDANRREWFEWGVTLLQTRWVWTRLINESSMTSLQSVIGNLPDELVAALPDGFTFEVCPTAEGWWGDAAGVLQQGKLLTLDYGLNAEEFFTPQRAGGTLRAYHHHRSSEDVLANPGEQDLTAHVNFTAVQRAGEAVGLQTETFVSQTQFLTNIAHHIWRDGSNFGAWTPEKTRQFQTLTHPEHLGRSFRVLVQSKG